MTLELRSPKFPMYTGKRKPKGAAASDPDCLELYRLKHLDVQPDGTAVAPDRLVWDTTTTVGAPVDPGTKTTGVPEHMQLDIEDITGENKVS